MAEICNLKGWVKECDHCLGFSMSEHIHSPWARTAAGRVVMTSVFVSEHREEELNTVLSYLALTLLAPHTDVNYTSSFFQSNAHFK